MRGDTPANLTERPDRVTRQLTAAWESFVTGTPIVGPRPRPVIFRGWERCRELGINPGSIRAPTSGTMGDLEARLARETFGIAGREVLGRYERLVGDSGHVMVLADASGQIVYAIGSKKVRDRLEQINFVPGGVWAEDVVGPNGVGTPIAVGRPELVFGSEHYCQGWQPWVCYGSPVRHPEGNEVIGAIDITGPIRAAQPETMALTIAIAQSIEQRIWLTDMQRREILRARYRDCERRWPGDALLLLTAAGRIIDANPTAFDRLDRAGRGLLDRFIADLMPGIWEAGRGIEGLGASGEWLVETVVAPGAGWQVRMEPVDDADRRLGAILIVHAASRRTAAPAGGLRALTDAMIRQVVADCGGRIGAAARRLGINRTTIYRRLKQRAD
jgi:transcriptional regulator of acetoin/glycerol metabolism